MRIAFTLPAEVSIHHTATGIVLELPDADAAAQAALLALREDPRFTIEQVCDRYHVTRTTLAAWERLGLAAIVIGGSKRFAASELLRFESEQTARAADRKGKADGCLTTRRIQKTAA